MTPAASDHVEHVPPLGDEKPWVRIAWAVAIVAGFFLIQTRAGVIIGFLVGIGGAMRGMSSDEVVALLSGDGAGSLYLISAIEFATLLSALVYAIGSGARDVGLRWDGFSRSMRLLAPLIVVLVALLWLDPGVSLQRALGSPTLGPALLLAVLVGITEEVVFRGLVIGALGGSRTPDLAVLISALLFGAVHVAGPDGHVRENWGIVVATIIGLFGVPFAVVYLRSGSILGLMLVHAAWDAMILS
ncbi:MAG: hypothetical protein JWM86_1038, partial [Thermoleophilia bacterium]|nr:hypothetical protein [Thermoleophilia bacterium]